MRGTSTGAVLLAMLAWPHFGCGPGRLPDLSFGSAGETGGASTEASTGPTTTADEGSSTTSTSESLGDDESSADDSSESSTADTGTSSTTTTTTTTTGDGDGESSEDNDGNEITDDSDDTWGIPPDVTNEPCQPLLQDCFPTHKCVPYATKPNSSQFEANKCMPILGDKKWGEPCVLSSYEEGQDDCDGEGFCWNLQWVQGELHGTCVPFCVGTPQNLVCPIGWGCMYDAVIALCPMKCDPLLQDCPNEYGCYWSGNYFGCAMNNSGAVGANEPCNKIADCHPGLGCVDGALIGCGDDKCCTPWCDLEAPDCTPPLHCEPFLVGDVPPMLAHIGICIQ